MTCIVGLVQDGKVWMGGDSAGIDRDTGLSQIRADEKVFRKGDFLIGFTTSFRMGQLIRYSFEPPKRWQPDVMEYMVRDFVNALRDCLKQGGFAEIHDNCETGGTFLIGYDGKLFRIDSDFQVSVPADGYDAVGMGQLPALGALYATQEQPAIYRVRTALEAAEHTTWGVREPFTILSLPK